LIYTWFRSTEKSRSTPWKKKLEDKKNEEEKKRKIIDGVSISEKEEERGHWMMESCSWSEIEARLWEEGFERTGVKTWKKNTGAVK